MYEIITSWWFIIGCGIYLGIGIYLYLTWFVMALIGCTSNKDTPFIIVYTIFSIIGWPGYVLNYFIGERNV